MTQAPDTEPQAADTDAAAAAPAEPDAPSVAPEHPPEAAAIASGDAAPQPASAPLKQTPLHSLHVARGARMVPFAGYDMPVQYASGIIAEHNHVRAAAGLFDVSHMGQAFLVGADHETVARALETLVPGDIQNLAPGRQRYTQLTDENGGILDDLMVTRSADPEEDGVLMLVVNAGTKDADYAHLSARLPVGVRLLRADHRALIAVQGPFAVQAVGRHCAEAVALPFMSAITTRFDGIDCHISRSGYTGEDGYEISCKATRVRAIAERLLSEPSVKLIGLGARDSLRLEAGLCLYGHDIDTTTSPVEAALTWSIGKRRRTEGGFPGAERIQREIADGASRLRVGIKPEGRAPAREGTEIRSADGAAIGKVTSGGFGPTVNAPISMGYVAREQTAPGTAVQLIVRDKPLPASIVALPFVPHRYARA
jgi:glycine cleavage system T protein (aminomethyltransferase)